MNTQETPFRVAASEVVDKAILARVQALVPLLQECVAGFNTAYLFGSAARGRLRVDSDLDIAVLAAGAVPPARLFEMAQICARRLDREVDLVDLHAAPLGLQARIVGEGIRLSGERDPRAAAFFENRVLSRYCAFVEERRPLVAEISRRRSIHAA